MNTGPNTIDDLSSLKHGWGKDIFNEPGDPLPDEVIDKAKRILKLIERGEYAIFPIIYGGIQVELEDDKDYFEIEILKDNVICFYMNIEEIEKK